MTKKKIAFVIGALTAGGAERVISTLSNEFISDFNVTIITFRKTEPFYRLDHAVTVISCFDEISQPNSFLESIKLNYKIYKRITQIVKDLNIDLLIGFITQANIKTVLAAKKNKIPCIISERSDPFKSDIPRFWLILRKLIYPRANSIVVQTKKVKEIYQKMLNHENIVVVPNPISTDFTELATSEVKKEKIILSVGRLNNDKRHDLLIKAFKTLSPKDWKVLIIGFGSNKSKLQKLINDLDLSHQIEIKSNIKNIEDYYRRASLFIFTSRAEGFPNVLLEAMYFKLPCISTDCNYGPSDIITNGQDGFLIPVDNQSRLVAKMDQVIKDEDLRTIISQNGHKTALKYKSKIVTRMWKNIISKHI
ncbi:glycosyltransferase family 4 protein [Winogradskyella sp. KYW1333]|uniref:glycosyltransferase family 4 protein n=1 Tax=Winogradskyella sp. KYW1333 TaxID=2282123 RepID=UPI000DF16D0E|nr:glycosyltransferase family 4 protein [Winogradskyella sp. KYW1333]RCT54252.1 glycosyltransferase family 4 protein [Winogradskyella sp. KYW1333]